MEPLVDNRFFTEEADAAFKRLDAILRTHGISHTAIRSMHCQRILKEAVADDSGKASLQTKASELLFKELSSGIEMIGRAIDVEPTDINRKRLLVAINRTNIPEQSPDTLLGLKKLTAEQADHLTFVYKTQYVPSLKRRSMGAPALRFEGLDGVTSGTSQIFTRSPIFLKLAPILGVACLFFVVYLFAK